MTDTSTLRILKPARGVFAYYDGRILGVRLHSEAKNWLDDGAYSLGIASYAIVEGSEAIVFDSHISLDHARAVRRHLERLGVTRCKLVLSHWHDDHVAGNAVFADGPIVAHRLTREALAANRDKLENGDPAIRPLVMPTDVFDDEMKLVVGNRVVEALHFDIHSADGVVLRLPDAGLLLAGDVVEDTITYISEADRTPTHISELGRLAALSFASILPAHGDPGRIAAGGYDTGLVTANRSYLMRLLAGEGRDGAPLSRFVAEDVAAGRIDYFEPYEAVHQANLKALAAAGL
ncbi:MBL fold metallo-hydrolase [Pleomorphomonas sp. JP5]|uniref:MBL fold metallo-hydrolase n=1 Tax=Pleomorphomonas sp. JP5 TaxID=2942998 RepID=UPI002042E2B6|nr:MBL fold metallo-hydrolase [Pleomorphomonas sp. JP5]MCM5558731.1 MBL fold metallo-hydrolase [Pleomorphomonas sp. JP5]